jgi:hypothetical protein
MVQSRKPGFIFLLSNDQLTDGGPSVMSELPGCVAGPPFGAAFG